MGWRRTEHERFRTLGRVRAAAGEPSDAPPAEVVEGVLAREIRRGTITADQADSWRAHLTHDFVGACDMLREREQQLQEAMAQAANRNGALHHASAGDADRLLATAEAEGRFVASRRSFWRERLRRDPAATTRLLTADPSEGGLQPIAAGMPHRPQGLASAATAIGSVHPQAATKLGYRVEREHPLAPGLPGRTMEPAPRGRTNVIADKT